MNRHHLVTLPVLCLLAACAVSPPPSQEGAAPPRPATPASTSASATTTPARAATASTPSACAAMVDGWTTRQRAGQLIMMGVMLNEGLTDRQSDLLSTDNIGAVFYIGANAVSRNRAAKISAEITATGGQVLPIIAADQEGGSVQRLRGAGFDTMPSAARQAELSDAALTRKATRWGKQLSAAGVTMNLAPVADVVPASLTWSNRAIGQLGRGYGATPTKVGRKNAAFVAGMTKAGVATSLKHFPTLGHVAANTDFSAGVTDTRTTRDDEDVLVPYRAGLDAGASTVMVSTTIYSRIDKGTPAVFSRAVIADMIRSDLGFDGVVLSDDMGAAAQVMGVPAGERAVRFVSAGGDMVINGNPATVPTMVKAMVKKAGSDERFAARVRESAVRVVELKHELGITTCEA